MQQAVIGFHQDEQMHWVVTLACGHTQHVRHDPPWTIREWVISEAERAKRIGASMQCKLCDESHEAENASG